MRKCLLAVLCGILFLFVPQFFFQAFGQQVQPGDLPSDSYLMSLVKKYLQTPVQKTIKANADVFLQRDITGYLQTTVFSGPEPAARDLDHGHDHKDAMLREFLNRPHPDVATLNKYFSKAAAEFGVPESILKAAAQVQSNWAQVSESMYGSWGVMGIIENDFVKQLSKAALMLQVDRELIKNDAETNIRAAAALLAHYQQSRPAAATLTDWFPSVADLTGLRDAGMKNELAERIFKLLQTGSKSVTLWGEIIYIEPVSLQLPKAYLREESGFAPDPTSSAVDYPNAVPNFTTCNFNSRPGGSGINFYFVHYVATGTYQGAIDWFKNCTSQVSAHYVIRNIDGEVSQVVLEANRAWSQGVTLYNDQGIGVEHEVLATNLSMWDSEPMLVSAANLCINVSNRWAIPKVRRVTNGDRGIYGHSDVKVTDCPNLTLARWNGFITRLTTVTAAAPTLYSIENTGVGAQVKATWKANIEPTLAGYRLYYANNDALTSWSLAANENTLGPATTSVTLDPALFIVPPAGNVFHFKLTAVVADGANPLVESNAGDIYSRSSNTGGPKVLIVDGFDRFGGTGSYTNSTHAFATSYFKALRNKGVLQISTVANERVEDLTFSLTNYDIVVWFVGDESTTTVVLSAAEKNAVKAFLDNGGKFLFSSSEAAYSIGRTGSTAIDLPFINNYLKATYVDDGASNYTPATGIVSTGFDGLNIPFGIVYPEDWPDAITAINGSNSILDYNISPKKAGVAYKGLFGAGIVQGAMIYLSFTLETAADSSITAFMHKALQYFDVPVISSPVANEDAGIAQAGAAKRINVLANDLDNGTPINPASLAIMVSPVNGTATTDNSGNVTYISNPGFTGNDQYQYRVQNSNNEYSNTATVSITVNTAAPCDPSLPETEDAYPKRDLRGAWIASVYNLDWPSSRSLSTGQQQAELIRMLDTLANARINTVFLQVRPESDALYQSAIDPWSYWLTNAQGTAPSPLWDPLSFAVTEAHKRGMELHAWINPYRAKQGTPTLAPTHVAVLHPDWTFVASTVTLLNPGIPDVRNYLTDVIADIARRYDVDGIHFDDYFYPSGMGTQDNATYSTYNPNALTLANWRRDNVNQLIAKVYDTIQVINGESNRNILFGVSPFGIWKVGSPTGITGQSSFNDLYCDPIAWMQAGKVDYVAPQLYWKISGPQDYHSLSKWWNNQGATYDRPVYPGIGLHKLSAVNGGWPVSEIINQLNINRSPSHAQVKGQILYSSKYLLGDSAAIRTNLVNSKFSYKAIPPALAYRDAICPNPPVNIRRDGDTLRWDIPAPAGDGDLPRRYIVYRFGSLAEASTHKNDASKIYAVVYDDKLSLPTSLLNNYFTVTSLDKNNNESDGGNVVVLPVTGLDLQVKLSGNTSLINWSTRSEINTKLFEVERSTDGRNFNFLSSELAAGNANSGKSYSKQDLLLMTGLYYYRIKSIDQDGRIAYSAIRTVLYTKPDKGIVAGPNPFTTVVNVSNLLNAASIELFDMSGRLLFNKKLKNETAVSLELADIPAGLYYLTVTKTNAEKTSIKLVKQ